MGSFCGVEGRHWGIRESEDGVILTFKISLIRAIRTSHLFATKYLVKIQTDRERKEKRSPGN